MEYLPSLDGGLLVAFLVVMLTMLAGFQGKTFATLFNSGVKEDEEKLTDVSKTFLRVAVLAYPDWPIFAIGFILDLVEMSCLLYSPLLLESIINEFTTTIGSKKSSVDVIEIFSAKTNSALALYFFVGAFSTLINYINRKLGQLSGNNTWKRAQVISLHQHNVEINGCSYHRATTLQRCWKTKLDSLISMTIRN